jgi:hypothetical protein
MNESFKVRCRDGPADRREIILVMEDCQIAVQWVLTRVANLAIDEENFLVDLRELVSATGRFAIRPQHQRLPSCYQRWRQFLEHRASLGRAFEICH